MVATEQDLAAPPAERPARTWPWLVLGVLVVLVLGSVARYLEDTVPAAAKGTGLEKFAAAVEYPIYAIALGLIGNVIVYYAGLRERIADAVRTEFFIKTGLVLLGASINLSLIAKAAGPRSARPSC
ncbi:hypothetical protein ACFQZ4_12625 [Catellatospora coxensis]